MHQEEALARDLTSRMAAEGIAAEARGEGVHWHVDVGPVAGRSVSVACFWYEAAVNALMLGMNPANGRSALRQAPQPYEGPEYLVELAMDGAPAADGRGHRVEVVVAGVRAWMSGASLAELVGVAPFIDEGRRAAAALAERIDPRLRRDIGGILDTSCGFTG